MIVEDLASAHDAPGSFCEHIGPKEFSVRTLLGAFAFPGYLYVEGVRRKKGVGNDG